MVWACAQFGASVLKNLKIGISVAALAVAAGITFYFSGSTVEPPDTEDSKTLWKFAECGHSFELTSKQFADEEKRAASASPLFCPKCNKMTAYRPIRCLKCDTIFFGPEVPGSSGECPNCRPKNREQPPEEEQPADAPKVISF